MSYGVLTELEKLKKKQQEREEELFGKKETITPVIQDTGYGVYDELLKLQEKKAESRAFSLSMLDDEDDIAPTVTIGGGGRSFGGGSFGDISPVKEDSWFQKGALEDGWSLKNIGKAILGTTADAVEEFQAGILGMGEKALDALAYVAPYIAQGQYYQNGGIYAPIEMRQAFDQSIETTKEETAKFIEKDLYDEQALVKSKISRPLQRAGLDVEESSVFGTKSDATIQSIGQMAGTVALSSAGVPWWLTTGTTAFGGETENALKQGATMEEAGMSGFIAAGAEILTEKLFGGSGLGEQGLINLEPLTRGIANKTVKILADYGVDMAAEGAEEVVSEIISNLGSALYKEENLKDILASEEALEGYLDAFIGGSAVGGTMNIGKVAKNLKNQTDYRSDLTSTEQKVVDKEYENRLAEAQKDGKLTNKQKDDLYNRVIEEMDKGYISTDTIEEVLGGESYTTYQDMVKSEDSLIEQEKSLAEESKKLEAMVWEKMTGEQQVRRDELRGMLPEIRQKIADQKNNSQRDQLKSKLSEEVQGLVKGSRLMESYNEVGRHKQRLEVDLNQYTNPNARATAENLAKVLDNSNKAHDVLDLMTKVAEDTGVTVTDSDAAAFEGTTIGIKRVKQFAADGNTTQYDIGSTNLNTEFKPIVKVDNQVVDNYSIDYKTGKITFDTAPTGNVEVEFRKDARINAKVGGNQIVIDMKSKKYLESLVGHEVTHVLENLENKKLYEALQNSIFEYARSKGEYDSRLKKLQDLYNGIEGVDVNAELTAELVGDYLFQDSDFISKLSTENRNVFQKVYDEIKHLLKLATAGSDQARKLEQVKYKFDQVYRELGKAQKSTADSGVKYSLMVEQTNGKQTVVDPEKVTRPEILDYIDKSRKRLIVDDTYFPVRAHTPDVLISSLQNAGIEIADKPLAMQAKKARQSQKEDSSHTKDGYVIRGHAMTAEEVLQVVENLDKPTAIIQETELTKTVTVDGKKETVELPDRFAVFVDLNNGSEYVAVIEFDSEINPKYIVRDGHGDDYHTTVTVFKPDVSRDGMPFDYLEYLSLIDTNYEIDIVEKRPTSEVAYGENLATTPKEGLSSVKVAQEGNFVKGKFSLSDSDGRELSPGVSKRFANSKAVDENGNLKRLYHGTASGEFTIFDKTKGSVEGDFGSGFYFTDNESDVSEHYEGGGPDFDNKVARRAEQIQDEEDIDYDEAEERAREELFKGSHKFEVYLNIENPAVVGRTMLFDNESYLEQYNEEDYDDYDDYIADVEQALADDIENIVWEVEKNVDVYSTEGLAEVLYEAYYEGGIGIEELKSKINDLYLEDSEGNLVGNEVTRQIIESLGYDGIIDPTVSGKWNMDIEEGTTHYIVFKPNQIKAITNQNPTDNPDIHRSISEASEAPKKYGDRATLGSEILFNPQEDIAPVAENAALVEENDTIAAEDAVEDLFPDDTAAIQEEYEQLVAQRDDILGAMNIFAAVDDTENAEKMLAELEAVETRIGEIEADESDRLSSISEADEPVAMDSTPEDVADNVPLTKTMVAELAKDVRSRLALPAKRVAEVRDLIARYSAEEFPSRAHLYAEIYDRFGTFTESYVDEELKGVKSLLRTYRIQVDDIIKQDIADYGQLMRSNFGKVRFSNEGLPVDVAYAELQDTFPGLFPESIDVPTDQLLRIIEVANMDTAFSKDHFIDSDTLVEVTDLIANSVTQFKQTRKETLANKHGRESFQSLMEDADQYVPPVKPNTSAPTRTEMAASPDDIAPVFDTTSGQQALMPEPEPEAEAPKRLTRKELHENIVDDITTTFREQGYEFTDVLKNAKDLSTFATVDNTPQRVMEKALGYKEGQILADMTVNKVAQNETEGIKWLNSFTDKKDGLLAKISKQYGIKPGSKESAAAQMYAEGYYVVETGKHGEFVDGKSSIIEYGDAELAKDFPDAKVQQNIKKLARDPRIRMIYDETLAAINESRTRNAYPEIPRLDNYYLHFRAMEDTFSRLGLPFNPNDIRAKDLPTDLNGVTADLKPGQPYFASAMHRKGKRTSFDLLGGLEKYLTSAKNQIYHIDDIQTLRALRNYVAQTYGQAHGLENLDTMSNEEAEQKIKDVYNSHLSTFAKFLNEEANILAGKTDPSDRGIESKLGRRGIMFLDTLNRQVGANMVGFNVSSSLTNFLAPVQAFAKTNKFDFVKAMAQTASNKIASIAGKGDNFVEESPVMIRRKGAERFYRTPWEKAADKGYIFMSMVDDLSTEIIARTKYNEFTRKGMDSQQAHIETDKWVSRLMGDRSLGQQPHLYNSKLLGVVTKFQLEVRNQLDSMFYDTIQEAKVSSEQIENKLLRNAKTAAKVTSTFAQLAVLQHLFGKAFESVAGYNPAFDIIEALIKTMGWDDEEDEEDTVLDNIQQGFLELLGDMPYSSLFLDGGRVPIGSALPISQILKGEDKYGNEKPGLETFLEALPYYFLPGGYGQIKKTKAGLEMFSEEHPVSGSYTDSGNLRFPVEDTTGNRVQAGLFGQWASENARDYFDNERKPLKENQIEEFMASGMKIQDYWDYREGLSEHDTLEEKADYIAGLDLPVGTKNILVNNLTDRKESIDLADYDEYGGLEEMDFSMKYPDKYEVAEAVGGYQSYKKYQEDMKGMKLAEKADYIAGLNLSTQQKNLLINSETDRKEPIDLDGYENYSSFEEFEYAKKNPEKYALAKAVGGYDSYTVYSDVLGDIKSDKDEWGESINGSRKPKVYSYIYSLDIPEIEQHILFKNEYPSTDDHNMEIIDYLNNRDDISYDEMVAILLELDFKVSADGIIRW